MLTMDVLPAPDGPNSAVAPPAVSNFAATRMMCSRSRGVACCSASRARPSRGGAGSALRSIDGNG